MRLLPFGTALPILLVGVAGCCRNVEKEAPHEVPSATAEPVAASAATPSAAGNIPKVFKPIPRVELGKPRPNSGPTTLSSTP